MSTRSGKRIHSSFYENTVKSDAESISKSDRKTRSTRLKENGDVTLNVTLSKPKKRSNYVAYPTDDELVTDRAAEDPIKAKSTRRVRRNTLKDHNITEPNVESDRNTNIPVRLTRRTKKISENLGDDPENTNNGVMETVVHNGKLKNKKSKKKKKSLETEMNGKGAKDNSISKKSKKKKKGKVSITVVENESSMKSILNKSNTSIDSFHSAAGSPLHNNCSGQHGSDNENVTKENVEKLNLSIGKNEPVAVANLNNTFDKNTKSKRSPSIKTTTIDKNEASPNIAVPSNSTFDKISLSNSEKLNTTYEKVTRSKSMSEDSDNANLNGTFDLQKSIVKDISIELNTTFDKEPKSNLSNQNMNSILNSTYEKSDKETKTFDSTFDKTDTKLDTTYDKSDSNKTNSGKSSLISSDETVNLTYDKSDNSRISITSDDSKTENIINTTPVLIESSLDESKIKSPIAKNANDTMLAPPITPLKREGTFTKDGPEVIMSPKTKSPDKISKDPNQVMSPKSKLSTEKTPTKRISLPSPGLTPFHLTRSLQKDKSVLNVTRSIEKSRRSSLADLAPRQTKVMFCSPVNNAAVVSQQKRKVIKSSLKGSNKSFVFNESVSAARPTVRKRSLTQNDADSTRAKRKRLADDMLQSVDRLSRPRTCSATAKLTENSTPSKKPGTPSKPKADGKASRTKLPNFAALHQKQFERMESLDECQERKAKRARQLLTPNGAVGILERSSPRGTKETIKEPKNDTPTKKLPTLSSLRPGYTRFGFKMHIEDNPFTVPRKTEVKPKEIKPNGLKRQATLPSLTGTTIDRKEAAKKLLLSEKSFTLSNKRDVSRKENRSIIKGVRTNRRFELQMKMRNIN